MGSLLMLGVLSISIQVIATPQTQPIQPCVVKEPCATEATSASKGTSSTKPTSAGKRTSSRRRASGSKPVSATAPVTVRAAKEIVVDASIPDDPDLEKMLTPYSAKVRALDVVIGKLEVELRKGPVGGGNLGNFVTDGMRAQSSARLGRPVVLAVANSGGLRKNTIAPGDLKAADIFELLPFENALVEVELTGEQLLNLLNVVVSSGDALSGVQIKHRMKSDNRPELISAHLLDTQGRETEIDPRAIYTIVTTDYLVKLRSGRYSILQEGKNVRPLSMTIRDALLDYVKAETAAGRAIKTTLDNRFVLTAPNAQAPQGPQR